MIGMVLRSGIPRSSMVTLSWMRPPSTSVWLLTSTTDVSASRLMNEGELVGATLGPIEFTSCFTASATVPGSPMRGVTVRITPASRYSTVWLSPAVVVVVVVVLVAAATWPVVWLVTTGTEVETLMTAFLFSDVSTCGFETMLILFSLASALSIAMNWSVENVNAVSPCPRGPTTEAGPPSWDGSDRVPPAEPGVVGRPGGPVLVLAKLKRPVRTAQSTPSRVSSVSVISATSTSISTWRGMRSSCLIVFSISVQLRGKVVTITALVTSSAMKRTCPSDRTSGAPGMAAAPGGTNAGGGAGGGAAPGRPGTGDPVAEGAAAAPSRAP